jgi:hypothetical protein
MRLAASLIALTAVERTASAASERTASAAAERTASVAAGQYAATVARSRRGSAAASDGLSAERYLVARRDAMNKITQTEYVVGHSSAEMQRLIFQAAVLRPLTERLLRNAGIRPGMRVLDQLRRRRCYHAGR